MEKRRRTMGKIKGNSYRKMAVLTFFLLAAAGSLVVGISAYLLESSTGPGFCEGCIHALVVFVQVN